MSRKRATLRESGWGWTEKDKEGQSGQKKKEGIEPSRGERRAWERKGGQGGMYRCGVGDGEKMTFQHFATKRGKNWGTVLKQKGPAGREGWRHG